MVYRSGTKKQVIVLSLEGLKSEYVRQSVIGSNLERDLTGSVRIYQWLIRKRLFFFFLSERTVRPETNESCGGSVHLGT